MGPLQDTGETGKGFCQWHTDGTAIAGRCPVGGRTEDCQHGFGCIPGSRRNAGKLWICSLVLFPDSAVYVLFIYNILNLSLGKDLQQYGLMEVIGVQQHQIIQMIFRQMMEVVLKGSFAGVAIGSLVVLGVLPSVIGKLYLGQAEELEGISFYQPGFFLIAILPVAVTLGVVILLVKQKSKF